MLDAAPKAMGNAIERKCGSTPGIFINTHSGLNFRMACRLSHDGEPTPFFMTPGLGHFVVRDFRIGAKSYRDVGVRTERLIVMRDQNALLASSRGSLHQAINASEKSDCNDARVIDNEHASACWIDPQPAKRCRLVNIACVKNMPKIYDMP